jgi:hypothetical protein
MISLMLITLLVLTLIGLITLRHAVDNAPDGQEDDSGFHQMAVAPAGTSV